MIQLRPEYRFNSLHKEVSIDKHSSFYSKRCISDFYLSGAGSQCLGFSPTSANQGGRGQLKKGEFPSSHQPGFWDVSGGLSWLGRPTSA
jgi:hypothetical protein